jgi:glycosyltransferase involved in cell wall biosynthesis
MEYLKPEIWILLDHYLPGYKGGGPIQSIANLVEALGEEFDFRIVTRDRDHGSRAPYPGVARRCWISLGKARVMYMPPGLRALGAIFLLLRRAKPRVLYLNSLFSRPYSLFPLLLVRLSLIKPAQILMAPRSELGAGSLRIKAGRKTLFLRIARLIGLYRGLLWQASTKYEKEDIISHLFKADQVNGARIPVWVARNLGRRVADSGAISDRRVKPEGEIRLVFLSRISRKKNLDGALRMLRGLKGQVQFTVYGPMEDPSYWKECEAILPTLPANVQVRYAGEVGPDLARDSLKQHDVFFMPTHNENFGHAILEALQAGCPVIISDQTAWRDLETAGVGWDIPLADVARFERALQQCTDMQPGEFRRWSLRAYEFAKVAATGPELVQEHRAMLSAALDG